MAEDEGRASRIAELKERHPRLTWAKIAAHVGVTERSAIKWQRTGALDTENAAKLAEVFGVDFDYIWWGPKPETPELFADRRNSPKGPVSVSRLDGELEQRISDIETTLAGIAELLREVRREARSERDKIRGMLDEQTSLLKDIRQARREAADVADRLEAAVRAVERAPRSEAPAPPPAGAKPVPKRSRRASGSSPA